MAPEFKPEEIAAWLETQILSAQIDWMDYQLNGEDELRRQQEIVLDGIYDFRAFFLGTPKPAPGQGYEPPQKEWKTVVRSRKLDDIDAKISTLVAKREAILNE